MEAHPVNGTGFGIVHLRAAGVSVVLDCRGPSLPEVLHWGTDLGELDGTFLGAAVVAATPPLASGSLDAPPGVSLVPEHSGGWFGLPGLRGHRAGTDWSPRFGLTSVEIGAAKPSTTGGRLTIHGTHDAAGLSMTIAIELTRSGLLRQQATIRNEHPESRNHLDGLVLALPVPTEATELLDLTGRHTRERVPQRRPFGFGISLRDNRRGRTGVDATLVIAVGTRGFGSAPARSGVCTSGGAATTAPMPSGCRRATRSLVVASCCFLVDLPRPRRGIRDALDIRLVRARSRRHGQPVPQLSALAPRPCGRRPAPPGDPEHLGGGVLQPRSRPPSDTRRPRR